MDSESKDGGRLTAAQVGGLLVAIHALQAGLWASLLAERAPHHRFNPVLQERALPAHWLLAGHWGFDLGGVYAHLCPQTAEVVPPEVLCLIAHLVGDDAWHNLIPYIPIEFRTTHPDFPFGDPGWARVMACGSFPQRTANEEAVQRASGRQLLGILNQLGCYYDERVGLGGHGDADSDSEVNRTSIQYGIMANPRATYRMIEWAMFGDTDDCDVGDHDWEILSHNPLDEVDEDMVAIWEERFWAIDAGVTECLGVQVLVDLIQSYLWQDGPHLLELSDFNRGQN
jgi:hypothetical protein